MHAVSKIRRAISAKIAVEDNKRCNITTLRKKLKTGSHKRGIDKTKRPLIPSYPREHSLSGTSLQNMLMDVMKQSEGEAERSE